MTAPTFQSLATVLTGWLFARRHTITRMILAVGDAAGKHFSSYHRLFSAARWSLDVLGLAVFDLMRPFLENVVMLGLDDTLARKRGLKMFGTLKLLCEHRQNQRFHVVADSAYGGQSVLCHLPPNCDLTSRLLKDARSYAAPPRRSANCWARPLPA